MLSMRFATRGTENAMKEAKEGGELDWITQPWIQTEN
jgi:hypothetical protein